MRRSKELFAIAIAVSAPSDYYSYRHEVYSSSKKPTREPILSSGAFVGLRVGLRAGLGAGSGVLSDQSFVTEPQIS